MSGKDLHSFWGCVLTAKYPTQGPTLPYRITNATLQSFHSLTILPVAIYARCASSEKDLQIALLTAEHPSVSLDLVVREVPARAYSFKRSLPDDHKVEVQLTGYYLDGCDACYGKGTSPLSIGGKEAPVLSTALAERMISLLVDDNVEVLVRKRTTENDDKLKVEKEKLEENLRISNRLVESLYSQVEELKTRVKYLEEKGK